MFSAKVARENTDNITAKTREAASKYLEEKITEAIKQGEYQVRIADGKAISIGMLSEIAKQFGYHTNVEVSTDQRNPNYLIVLWR